MGKQNANQKRRKQAGPPLSAADKALYWLLVVILCVLCIIFVYVVLQVPRWIAFYDPAVVAYSSHSYYIATWVLLVFTSLSSLLYIMHLLDRKVPVLGNKEIRYGAPPWPKDFYPLTDPRHKTIYKSPASKKRRSNAVRVWLLGFLCLLFLASWEFCGRDVLDGDHTVTSYNAMNRVTDVYDSEDFSHLTVKTHHYTGRAGNRWSYSFVIRMEDGTEFEFRIGGFRSEDDVHTLSLKTMLSVKDLFREDEIDYVGAENVTHVAEYYNMNQEQLRMLQELFVP